MTPMRFLRNLSFGLTLLLASGGRTAVSQSAQAPRPTAPPQSIPQPLAFDAISIHPTRITTTIDSTPNGNVEVSRITIHALDDGYMAENVTLKFLIASTYNIRQDHISGGPDWIDSNHYDINAKVSSSDGVSPPKLSKAQRKQMLLSLLADRFKLIVHTQTREDPIYELNLTKSGPRFHQATPGDTFASGVKGYDGRVPHPGDLIMTGPGQLTGQGVTLSSVIDTLSQMLGRPIVDKTGLTGKYDISLTWAPEDGSIADPAPPDAGPSLFTAVQEQLGLKLDSTKGPVEGLVIDHIERPPEN